MYLGYWTFAYENDVDNNDDDDDSVNKKNNGNKDAILYAKETSDITSNKCMSAM